MSNEFIVKYRPFNKIQCCFDTVTVFGNNIERVFHEILSFRQSLNKLNMFNLFRLCRKDKISFDIVDINGNIVAKNSNNVEATFDFVEATFAFF